jgi:hypothetical protein
LGLQGCTVPPVSEIHPEHCTRPSHLNYFEEMLYMLSIKIYKKSIELIV